MAPKAQLVEVSKIDNRHPFTGYLGAPNQQTETTWENIKAGYSGVYIQARILQKDIFKDNPDLGEIDDQCQAHGIRRGFYVQLQQPQIETYGLQITQFASLVHARPRDLPIAVMLAPTPGESPQSYRGDCLNYLKTVLLPSDIDSQDILYGQTVRPLMIRTNPSSIEFFWSDFSTTENPKDLNWMVEQWLWLEQWQVPETALKPWPWAEWHAWGSSLNSETWRGDQCTFYEDNHLTKPAGLVCNPTPPPVTHTCPEGQVWNESTQKCETVVNPPTDTEARLTALEKAVLDLQAWRAGIKSIS
jgi:hypothetical protein